MVYLMIYLVEILILVIPVSGFTGDCMCFIDNYYCCPDNIYCCPYGYICATGSCITVAVIIVPILIVFSIIITIVICICVRRKRTNLGGMVMQPVSQSATSCPTSTYPPQQGPYSQQTAGYPVMQSGMYQQQYQPQLHPAGKNEDETSAMINS